jgi:hypothetical protein
LCAIRFALFLISPDLDVFFEPSRCGLFFVFILPLLEVFFATGFSFPQFCCPCPRSVQERAGLVSILLPSGLFFRSGSSVCALTRIPRSSRPVECPDNFLACSNFVARRSGHRVRSFGVGGLRRPRVPASSRRHWFFLFSVGLRIFHAAGPAAALSYFSLALFLLPGQRFPVSVSAWSTHLFFVFLQFLFSVLCVGVFFCCFQCT